LRGSAGYLLAEILSDQRERQVDASGNAGGTPDLAVLDEYAV
jgi:hypothetical protein